MVPRLSAGLLPPLVREEPRYNAALRDYYATHADALRAYNRARSEFRRGYQREYQRQRRAFIRAGEWKPRASYPRA